MNIKTDRGERERLRTVPPIISRGFQPIVVCDLQQVLEDGVNAENNYRRHNEDTGHSKQPDLFIGPCPGCSLGYEG